MSDPKKITPFLTLLTLILLLPFLIYMKETFKSQPPINNKIQAPLQKPPVSNPKNNIAPPISVPKITKKWGVFAGEKFADILAFEKMVDSKADIQAKFLGMGGDPFPNDSDKRKTLLIFWEPNNLSLDDIISGNADLYIKQFADDARSYGENVLLVPFPEMNGNWDSWSGTAQGNSPEKIILAFRHIHDLFLGASNVKFGWAVNNDSIPDTAQNQIANYYPGGKYVDYVGVDGFNDGNPWQTYSEVFSSALDKIKIYNKPIYIFSMACSQGQQKAAWITDALNQIYKDPRIFGFVWFNENKEQNWLVNSDASSLEAFKTAIRSYQ